MEWKLYSHFFHLKLTVLIKFSCLEVITKVEQCAHLMGFMQECFEKYDQEIYDKIMEVFDCLPIAAVINGKFLCVHGGISPSI
jgi:hypothetical protein